METAAQENSPRHRRTLRITHRKFQLSFLLFCFAIGALTTATAVIAMHWIVTGITGNISEIRTMDWDQIEQLLAAEASKATLMIAAVSVINIVLTAVISFFFSHHVAGIVYRLTTTLHRWSSGERVEKIVPRKGDFFVELVDEVNEVIKEPKSPTA